MQILMQNEDFIKKMNNLPPNISMYSFVKCLNDLHIHDRNSHDAVTSAANRSNMKFDDFCEHFFKHGFNKILNPIPYTFGLIHNDALLECRNIYPNDKESPAFSTIAAITKEERGAYSKASPDEKAKFIHSRINIKDMNYNLLYKMRADIPIICGCINHHLESKKPLSKEHSNALNKRYDDLKNNESFISFFSAYQITNTKVEINNSKEMPRTILAIIKEKEKNSNKKNNSAYK